jgi:cell division septal protein FtsQ
MMSGAWARRLPFGRRTRRGSGFAVRQGPRRSRRTLVMRLVAAGMMLAGSGTLVWWVLNSSTFAVKRIESGAYRYTSATELQDVFGEFVGRNIWTLGTDEVAARVGQLPWIRDLRVVRRLPATLEVDFREWTPLLLLAPVLVEGQMRDRLALREDGEVHEFPAQLLLPGLPLLVGLTPARPAPGEALCLPEGQAALLLELIGAMEQAGLETASPVDFVFARAEGFAIVLQNEQGTLLVGREEFGPRLQRYMTARDHLAPGLEYDLRFEDRITVRERD